MKPSMIRFADEKLLKAFRELKQSKIRDERRLYRWLVRAFEDIRGNAFCGIQIPKGIIPKEYIRKYRIDNLWKYNLPNAWRLIYSIRGEEIAIISIIVEWLAHKGYERKFKY